MQSACYRHFISILHLAAVGQDTVPHSKSQTACQHAAAFLLVCMCATSDSTALKPRSLTWQACRATAQAGWCHITQHVIRQILFCTVQQHCQVALHFMGPMSHAACRVCQTHVTHGDSQ